MKKISFGHDIDSWTHELMAAVPPCTQLDLSSVPFQRGRRTHEVHTLLRDYWQATVFGG